MKSYIEEYDNSDIVPPCLMKLKSEHLDKYYIVYATDLCGDNFSGTIIHSTFTTPDFRAGRYIDDFTTAHFDHYNGSVTVEND